MHNANLVFDVGPTEVADKVSDAVLGGTNSEFYRMSGGSEKGMDGQRAGLI